MGSLGNQNQNFKGLYEALMGNTYSAASYKPKVRIITKRGKHSDRLAERIERNALMVDKLIEIIKSLNKKQGTEDEVDKLLDITRDLLENNAKLKEQVSDALQDIPING